MGDVLQAQHFDGTGAGHAGDGAKLDQGQRDNRQDDVAERLPRVIAEGDITHHRQPAQLDPEPVEQQKSQPEAGDRQQQGRTGDHAKIESAVLFPRRQQTQRHGNQRRHQHRHQDDAGAHAETVEKQRQDRLIGGDGETQITTEHRFEPDHELHDHRLIETKCLAGGGQALGVGHIAEHQQRRITRHHADDGEHHQRDEQQRGQRHGQPLQYETHHVQGLPACRSTVQRRGLETGQGRSPCT
ncbi:hypothetical protein D3C87_1294050 [compost metagenome]